MINIEVVGGGSSCLNKELLAVKDPQYGGPSYVASRTNSFCKINI